jgi:pyruvate/2-oxoglutarate dehydrogenase complex dihydrolipoamide acyltransferase (E2) component
MATRATSVQITMPQMGESVTEGTVLGWLKQVGDRVEADEPLVEISTDKVDAEVPAPTAGTLVKILAEADETVQVGSVLGEIEPDDGNGAPAAAAPGAPAAPDAPETPDAPDAPDAEPVDVTFPEMGDSVAEGTVLEWRVKVGDSVAVDDPLVEIPHPLPGPSPRSLSRPTRRSRWAPCCAGSRLERVGRTVQFSRRPR